MLQAAPLLAVIRDCWRSVPSSIPVQQKNKSPEDLVGIMNPIIVRQQLRQDCGSSATDVSRQSYEIRGKDISVEILTIASNSTRLKLAGREAGLIEDLISDSIRKAQGIFL